MKVVPIAEAGAQINQLAIDALKGELVVLTIGAQELELRPRDGGEEEYDPELEAELLKAVDGPFKPYSSEEAREVVERVIAKGKNG